MAETKIETVDDVFTAFGGPAVVMRILDLKRSTATEIKRRGSIPVEYWPGLIEAAPRYGISGLTSDKLLQIHVAKGDRAA